MPDPLTSNPETPGKPAESTESFGEIFSQYQKSHSHKTEGSKQLAGTVIAVTSESVFFDIGYKSEGILPLTALQGEPPKPGDKFLVTVKGRDPDGYYELSRFKVERPTDWDALEKAFADKAAVLATVTAVVKGGFSVDVGVRAFMPASRSGVRDAAEMENLVGQEIRCRIIKLDVTDEDVVVDRRVVAEEEERSAKDRLYSQIAEGATVSGTVRSLTDYGAFVDVGGVDALLHVGDISWSRVNKPSDVLSVGQQIEVKVLKLAADAEKRRISVGLKQLQPHPWDAVADKYKAGDRVRGTVTRLAEFGAFVELEPGIEGLIHISEMSWAKGKIRKASDVVKQGETVEAVILGINAAERRISLGLKQALGDPWVDVPQRFPVGSAIEGPVTSLTKFGAFVQLVEGIEGMVHVSEISAEKRINQPADVLRVGQVVQALVIAVDPDKRQMRLSMKQLVPTSIDEYLAEHKEGDVVTGRLMDDAAGRARVELGEGIHATCRTTAGAAAAKDEPVPAAKADLSSLSSMLQARWKTGAGAPPKAEPAHAGQVRSFRILKLDRAAKKIEVELA
ncbi:30S ribosomal protein S1 [Candidatus Sulfotelmatobacter kueseliae]|uniref:30S ribosomal protein S1 n=1 Tax=Candidatus Sulfotelmatobacter kueseliae TaxID=2042962 RepID=A0A2U3KCJ1_9BACT|nr:30S ribosomal protein S1 [Candidatus Sulfotelmatobacter kueseliae]